MVKGLMQTQPLNVCQIISYAGKWHGEQEVVSRTVDGRTEICTYRDLEQRSKLCAIALNNLGYKQGSFIATLAWNTTRHMEAWYGIMGIGAVCHTLNPRLSDADIQYIANDAEDCCLLADPSFAPLLERIVPHIPTIQAVVLLADRSHMPQSLNVGNVPVLCYEDLLASALPGLPGFKWAEVDENEACGMCYTSGTTGKPKGVLYSHRSQYLHALLGLQSDSLPLTSASVCMAVVPMYHANSWGLVFMAPMVGAKLVLPGPFLDGESVYLMMETFGVTMSAGVPTVWLNLVAFVEAAGLKFSSLKIAVFGGAAPPRSMIEVLEKKYGVEVRHLWGMTEISPLGTVTGTKGSMMRLVVRHDDIITSKLQQGRPHVLCDMRIVDDEGNEVVHDGKAFGHLQVRGPFVVRQYFKQAKPAVDADSWFATGDVCSISPRGFMMITDRSKDVVKSGGEWISSIEVENIVMGHAAVAEAAVVAIPDEKWGERPLLVVVLKPHVEAGEEAKDAIYKYIDGKIAKFATPDDIIFVPEIPHTATGKISKITLREMFKTHKAARSRI